MQEKLTDRAYWATYWANYKYEKVPDKVVYEQYLPMCQGAGSFIEIGGFPGINALYFYRHVCKDVTLLDFFVDKQIINRFEKYNEIAIGTIKCVETDFFSFVSPKKYDIVFSSGFIEHFSDTNDVIQRHVELLSDQGKLMIVLPNFKGINGAIQWLFDRENLKAHNLKSMDIKYLRQIAEKSDLKDVIVEYSPKPMVWLEPKPCLSHKIFRIPVKLLSLGLKLFPMRCQLLSSHIILTARK